MFLSQHLINLWKSLPEEVEMAPGLVAFNKELDGFWEEKLIIGDMTICNPLFLEVACLQMPDAKKWQQDTDVISSAP